MPNNLCEVCGAPLNEFGECEYHLPKRAFSEQVSTDSRSTDIKDALTIPKWTDDSLAELVWAAYIILSFCILGDLILNLYIINRNAVVVITMLRLITGIYITLWFIDKQQRFWAILFGLSMLWSILHAVALNFYY
jgi:hypothetical protein